MTWNSKPVPGLSLLDVRITVVTLYLTIPCQFLLRHLSIIDCGILGSQRGRESEWARERENIHTYTNMHASQTLAKEDVLPAVAQ